MSTGSIVGLVTLFFVGAIFAALLARLGDVHLGRTRYGNLRRLVEDVARHTGFQPTEGRFPTLDHIRLLGEIEGRSASVRFVVVKAHDYYEERIQLSVLAANTPNLVISEETFSDKLGKVFGSTNEIEIGDAQFDARFLLETKSPAKASRFLRGDARKIIWRLFDVGAKQVRFHDGEIFVVAPMSSIEPVHYRSILESLAKMARSLDSQPLEVSVLGGKRRAHVDEKGKTRCPYCRENLTGDEPNLVACEKCQSVVHDECWKEHDGCPLLGCEGGFVERPRGRERSA